MDRGPPGRCRGAGRPFAHPSGNLPNVAGLWVFLSTLSDTRATSRDNRRIGSPQHSRWVVADRFHPLKSLADVGVLECELSGALELQQDGPIFHPDPMRLAVTVREPVINSRLAPLPPVMQTKGAQRSGLPAPRSPSRVSPHVEGQQPLHGGRAPEHLKCASNPRPHCGMLVSRSLSDAGRNRIGAPALDDQRRVEYPQPPKPLPIR